MGKTPLRPEEASRQLNVKLPPEDADFVEHVLRPALGVGYNAEAIREVISHLRMWFRLPAYVVEPLRQDAASEHFHLLSYLQRLLLERYELLTRSSPLNSGAISNSAKGTSRPPRR